MIVRMKMLPRIPAEHVRRSQKTRSLHNLTHRPAKAAKGNGRIQRAARRGFIGGGEITTADVTQIAYCRKVLLHGRRLEKHDYRLARAALRLIADPIGRAGGQGRPLLWRLKDAT
jgi:hypothetical protein